MQNEENSIEMIMYLLNNQCSVLNYSTVIFQNSRNNIYKYKTMRENSIEKLLHLLNLQSRVKKNSI